MQGRMKVTKMRWNWRKRNENDEYIHGCDHESQRRRRRINR
jgi:hypothetical protein